MQSASSSFAFPDYGTEHRDAISVTVHEAMGLSSGIFGTKDPYVVGTLGNLGQHTFHTTVINNGGRNPKWDQTFTFPYAQENVIQFVVYDKDKFSRDDKMGEGTLDLSYLPGQGVLNTDVSLAKAKGNGPAGVLRVTVKLLRGAPAPPVDPQPAQFPVPHQVYDAAVPNFTQPPAYTGAYNAAQMYPGAQQYY